MRMKDGGAGISSAPPVSLCAQRSGSLRIINVIDGQNKVWFGQREKSKPITKSSSCLSTLFCKHPRWVDWLLRKAKATLTASILALLSCSNSCPASCGARPPGPSGLLVWKVTRNEHEDLHTEEVQPWSSRDYKRLHATFSPSALDVLTYFHTFHNTTLWNYKEIKSATCRCLINSNLSSLWCKSNNTLWNLWKMNHFHLRLHDISKTWVYHIIT